MLLILNLSIEYKTQYEGFIIAVFIIMRWWN